MKHCFLINPSAGKSEKNLPLIEKIEKLAKDNSLDYEIYLTTSPGDGTRYVKEKANQSDEFRIYACGGDGTIFEAINGAVEKNNIHIAAYPCGTGNDFTRCFQDNSLETLICQKSRRIDSIKVGDYYCINVANIGLDADINAGIVKLKKKYSATTSYNISIFKNLFGKINKEYQITIDGKMLDDNIFCLMSISNGKYYGGGYMCAPRSDLDDGYMEFCAFKKVSLFTVIRLLKQYKKGNHLDNPKFKKYIYYTRAKKVEIESKKVMSLCMDGENISTNKISLEICPKSINIINK